MSFKILAKSIAFLSVVALAVGAMSTAASAAPRARHWSHYLVAAESTMPHNPARIRIIRNDDEGGASVGNLSTYVTYRTGALSFTQTSPHIYVLFWGNWNASGDPYGVESRLLDFYQGVGGSTWNRTVTQYGYNCGLDALGCQYGVRIQNSTGQLKGWVFDPSNVPTSPTAVQIAAEAQKAAGYFNDRSINAQYVIALPSGHRDQFSIQEDFCAWHNATLSQGAWVSFTAMPYIPNMGNQCGAYRVNQTASGILDGVTIYAGHEYAESETDPYMNTWLDPYGGEIADKCIQSPSGYYRNLSFSTGTFAMQALWSNYAFQTTGAGCQFWS